MPDTAAAGQPAPTGRQGVNSRIRRVTSSTWFHVVAAFVVLALVQGFIVKVYYVPSGSMESTMQVGDRILVNRLAFVADDPKTGDVVVFNASELWEEPPAAPSNPFVYTARWVGGLVGIGPSLDHTLVKRVIAGPGQTVSCCDAEGRLVVDGEAIDEPWVSNDFPFEPGVLDCASEPASQRCFDEFTVPPGEYIVLGDNRMNSADSLHQCRAAGAIPECLITVGRDDIVGRAFFVVLPFARWGAV